MTVGATRPRCCCMPITSTRSSPSSAWVIVPEANAPIDRIVRERGHERGGDVGQRRRTALHAPVPSVEARRVEHVLQAHLERPEPGEQRDGQRGAEHGGPDAGRTSRPDRDRARTAPPCRRSARAGCPPSSRRASGGRRARRDVAPAATRHDAMRRRATTDVTTASAPRPRMSGSTSKPRWSSATRARPTGINGDMRIATATATSAATTPRTRPTRERRATRSSLRSQAERAQHAVVAAPRPRPGARSA